MRYQVIYGETEAELSELVEALMIDGWRPQGGVCIAIQIREVAGQGGSSADFHYWQAMVRGLPSS